MIRPLTAPTLLAAALLAGAACVPVDRSPAIDRDGPGSSGPVGNWQLERIDASPPGSGSQLLLELRADGTVGGWLDCNRLGGSWTMTGTHVLQFGPLVSTRMGCAAGEGARTTAFVAALQAGPATVTQDGPRLQLTAGGQTGVFRRLAVTR